MGAQSLAADLLSVEDIFSNPQSHYEIPLYQRNYAWGVEQIEQLIDDVWSAAEAADADYFLGNLIVQPRPSDTNQDVTIYEVIDGQQRLTTLFMLLTYLNAEPKARLIYQARSTATEALGGLTRSDNEEGSGIHTGYKAIEARMARFTGDGTELARFTGFLRDRVVLVRAALPDATDLNKYFEIMNTRGQQLEPVDIVKARMMSYLRDDTDVEAARACFAWIWDACSSMDSYIQMSLADRDPVIRSSIFGDQWDRLAISSFSGLQSVHSSSNLKAGTPASGVNTMTLRDAVAAYARTPEPQRANETEQQRFEAPIKFPNLLLHALKVLKGSSADDLDDSNGQLDDGKLIALFENHFDLTRQEERSNAVMEFAETLLRTKFVLDNFVLKREFTASNGDDGAWSLKRLVRGESGDKVGARFPNSFAAGTEEWDDTPVDGGTRDVLLLQSMLRVTYTSPRTMHWITAILRLPVLDTPRREAASAISQTLRDYARTKVRDAFFKGESPTGFGIERIVFTYLDFLLALGAHNEFPADPGFVFVYRNSIEHFFPQFADREQAHWDRVGPEDPELHWLGNLALVSVGANSKFSNNLPENKVRFQETITQSTKLQLMAQLATRERLWDLDAIREHQKYMVELLKSDLTG